MSTSLFTIDNKMDDEFGPQMKAAREKKNWSLEQLAQRMHLIDGSKKYSRSYMWQIEEGKRRPKPELRRTIALALDLPLADPGGQEEFSHPTIRKINYKLLALGKVSEALLDDVNQYVEFRIEQLKRQEGDSDSGGDKGPAS